jgi:hypothetical protein
MTTQLNGSCLESYMHYIVLPKLMPNSLSFSRPPLSPAMPRYSVALNIYNRDWSARLSFM